MKITASYLKTKSLQLLNYMTFDAAKYIIQERSLFFIVGMGRSGTSFLANLLNKVHGFSVYHETREDYYALVDAYWNSTEANKYIWNRRRPLIAARILLSNCMVYGEVNSMLRYHVDALRNCFDANVLHLVRDGRDVVRSIMDRNSFTPLDQDHTGRIYPYYEDPFHDRWEDMDRFERVCWYWTETNRFLLEKNLPLIRFEDIIKSYEMFHEQVLCPIKGELPYQIWKTQIEQPRNETVNRTFPIWEEWSTSHKKIFQSICGDMMARMRYKVRE